MKPTPLDSSGRHELANALGDTHETAVVVHSLRRGLCRAVVSGKPSRFAAAVVRRDRVPHEPFAFGTDAKATWSVLASIDGWESVNVAPDLSRPLGRIIGRESGRRVGYYGVVYHTATAPVALFENEDVRSLAAPDAPLLDNSWFHHEFESVAALLEDGAAAGAVVDGRLVSLASTNGITDGYASIGVRTLEEWRERGYATAAASIVARQLQQMGRTPVWSAGEDNYASMSVAEKLGFVAVSRRVFINVWRDGQQP